MASVEAQTLDQGLAFGAHVAGTTGEPLDDPGIRATLKKLLQDRGVIVCRDVEQTSAMQVKLSEIFGPIKEHPVYSVARADRNRQGDR